MKLTKSLILSSLILSSLVNIGASFQLPQIQSKNEEIKSSQLLVQQTTQDDRATATIDKCIPIKNAVQCSVVVRGKKAFESLVHCNGSNDSTRIFDLFGNVYICSKVRIASEETNNFIHNRFPEDIPVKIHFIFQGVPSQTQQLAGLEMKIGSNYYQFKNIKIAK